MPSWAETRLACQGLLKLARFDPDFVRFFDRSRAGAMRSFWLAPIIYPYAMLNTWITFQEQAPDDGLLIAAMTVAYTLAWIVMPLLLLMLSSVLEREDDVVGCITVYNWASLLWQVIALPLLLLDLAGVPDETLTHLDYAYLLVTAVVAWFLFRHALRITGGIAAALTVADLFMTHVLIVPMLVAPVLGGQAGG